jgi:hypothetical protein
MNYTLVTKARWALLGHTADRGSPDLIDSGQTLYQSQLRIPRGNSGHEIEDIAQALALSRK